MSFSEFSRRCKADMYAASLFEANNFRPAKAGRMMSQSRSGGIGEPGTEVPGCELRKHESASADGTPNDLRLERVDRPESVHLYRPKHPCSAFQEMEPSGPPSTKATLRAL